MAFFDRVTSIFKEPQTSQHKITFFDGYEEVDVARLNHVKTVRNLVINRQMRNIAQVVQIYNGDCVIANWLNTISVLRSLKSHDCVGTLPGEVVGARSLALQLRHTLINPPTPGDKPFSYLSNGDVINLYQSIFSDGPTAHNLSQAKNYFQFDHSKINPSDFANFVLSNITDRKTFPSGVAAIATKKHSHVVMACNEGILSIDAANHSPIDYQTYTTPGHLQEYLKPEPILTIMSPGDARVWLANRVTETKVGDTFDVLFVAHSPGARINVR